MTDGVAQQKKSFNHNYSQTENWSYWDSQDPLTQYLLTRRLRIAVDRVMQITQADPADWNVLVLCGGVGGEGSFLANYGFKSITVSDISETALQVCNKRDSRLETRVINAEQLELPDESYDLVLVQDGLHHLPRPVLGFTEMLRVARKAVIVIEPHLGLVANLLGMTWENHGGTVNYVFRWNALLLKQATKSYILESPCYIQAIRLWNHNLLMAKVGKILGGKQGAVLAVKSFYFILDWLFWWLGNMMIGIVIKYDPQQ
ncbi:class I SAM-dependent methyltransferase [Oscillatoria acuminata]|uniref:Methylase involved in ubiquinone/menaquinone biosynthesis n=1 Tax=Oscillatoria acuminata PCC 6304 TaxID=56110 RepID=K9TIC0_9CYAN|nr:class I SAM-dependent methyltransferase [Oscillatoria acuminata]AFY82270.1 methylase involved in ubiquinone/menaquinone biosynthesis [Oscillatoria acuminata PCC 6304]